MAAQHAPGVCGRLTKGKTACGIGERLDPQYPTCSAKLAGKARREEQHQQNGGQRTVGVKTPSS